MGQFNRDDTDAEDRRESGTRRVAGAGRAPLIVFADDSAVQTLKMRELLEGAGYRAVMASDGQSAVRRARELHPDLVILDLEMPGMDGGTACRTIRDDKDLAGTPVLILTAHDDPKRLVQAFAAGCTGFIVKGMTDAALLDKIALHLQSKKIVRRAE